MRLEETVPGEFGVCLSGSEGRRFELVVTMGEEDYHRGQNAYDKQASNCWGRHDRHAGGEEGSHADGEDGG